MSKMTIEEAAKYFGVSKEAIHNRIRRGSLQSVVEDGVKLVMVEKNQSSAGKRGSSKQNTSFNHDKYYKFLEEQNAKLQNKVEMLESETRALRDQKEKMLIEERMKIEQIYKNKDEQLKNILNVISSKFIQGIPLQVQDEHVEAEIEMEEEETPDELISLKKYLKQIKAGKKKTKKIKNRFKKRAKKDERIIKVADKYYVNISKYDYKDLLN